MLKILERERWLDVLDTSPLTAGDARFLRDFFLPAHAQLRRPLYEAALSALDRRAARRGGAPVLAARARIKRLLGDATGAAFDLEAALRLDPACAAALAYRGEARLAADPKGALPDLVKAAALEPGNAAFWLWLGYAQALGGDAAKGLRSLDEAVARGKRPGSAFVLRGILRERMGALEAAEADYTAAAKLKPRCPGLYTLRATVRWKLGRRGPALEDAHQALLLHPENLDAFMRIVYLCAGGRPAGEKRRPSVVVAEVTGEQLALDARCAWAHALRAEVLDEGRLSVKAGLKARHLRRAVALAPKNAWMRAFLGRALSGLHKHEGWVRRGLKELDAAVALRPGVGWIRCWRAEVLDKLGQGKRALKDLDRGLADDPDYRLGHAWRAALRERHGDEAGAVEDLTACLALMPRPGFHHQRAALCWRLGRAAEAAADLTRCVSASPRHALAYSRFHWLLRLELGGSAKERPSLFAVRPRFKLRSKAAAGRATLRLQAVDPAAWCALIKALPGGILKSSWKKLALDSEKLGAAPAWRGRALLDEDRLPAADRALSEALAAGQGSFLALSWRGEARFLLGDVPAALKDLDEAVRLKASYVPSYLWRCLCLLTLGRAPEALEDLLRACRADPAGAARVSAWARWTVPGFWARLGRACAPDALAELALLSGQAPRALRLLERAPGGVAAARKTPGLAAALMLRAKARRGAGDLQGALDDARRAEACR